MLGVEETASGIICLMSSKLGVDSVADVTTPVAQMTLPAVVTCLCQTKQFCSLARLLITQQPSQTKQPLAQATANGTFMKCKSSCLWVVTIGPG